MTSPSRQMATTKGPLSLQINGMSCASCVGRVEGAIANLGFVQSASVNLATERADIVLSKPASAKSVVRAIESAGYEVKQKSADISIKGMSCASCVGTVEKEILAVPGVVNASVNLATERARVEFYAGATSAADIASAVNRIGYEARTSQDANTADEDAEARDAEIRKLKQALVLAAVMALPVFILEMGSHFIEPLRLWILDTIGVQNSRLLQFFLTSAVLFGPGRIFFRKGIPALRRLAPDMNSLVAIGTGAAWSYSAVVTFLPTVLPEGTRNVYFEVAAVIVVLILLGRFLEARAKGRTSQAIRRLVDLQAKTARVIRDGTTFEVDLSEVLAGDIVQMRPGERIPVDGEIRDGSSYLDESMISGEPVPVAKGPGDEVVGGTINKTGAFTFAVTRVGADTVLAQIIRMVEQAQGSKLPIQQMVDKVTAVFVPAVMGLAILTALIWFLFGPDPALTFALVNAVAVLIIACPCAMGLATPTSIMVGTGRGAEMGVLFRQGEALQTLRDARIVAMDKTGTLTKGKPELTDFIVADGVDATEALTDIASIEALSEHPLAEAIVAHASSRNLQLRDVTEFVAEPGFGVSAKVEGRKIEIGADRYMRQLGCDIAAYQDTAIRMGDEAKSPLYAAIDGRVAAVIAVADAVKPSSRQAIDALHALGLKVAMITGDNVRTAKAVATQLGIDDVVAEVLPGGKVDTIKSLRASHGHVAFVGDGINDAPALAEADVGLAIGSGTDIAIEAADVVLMSGDLIGVPNAVALSKLVIRNIKQNLFWAFAYNTVLIPVAAGVLYPIYGILLSPILGAGAMALSSVCVLTNALRLRRFVPPTQVAEVLMRTRVPAPAE